MALAPTWMLHRWIAVTSLLVLGSFLLALVIAPVHAQAETTTTTTPLAQYDANENGKVDEAEFAQAVQDYKAGTIDRATMATVAGLYLSTFGVIGQGVSCGEYDFNGDGGVDANEQEAAIGEWEAGIITSAQLAVVLSCPPPRVPPPTDTPTPTPTHTPTPTPTDTPTPTPEPPTPTPVPPPVVTLPLLPAPANLWLTSWNSASVNLKWSKVTGAERYRVFKYVAQKSDYVAQGHDQSDREHIVLLLSGEHNCGGNARYTTFRFQVRAIGDGDQYAASPGDAATLSVNIPCRPLVTVEAVTSAVTEGQSVRFRFTADPPPLLAHDEITVGFTSTVTGDYLRDSVLTSIRMRGTGGTRILSLATDKDTLCAGNGSVSLTITTISFSSFPGVGGQQAVVGAGASAPYGIGNPKSAAVTIQDVCDTPPPPPPSTPDQPGVVTLSDTTPQVGTAITATLTDPDGGIANLTWQWQRLVTGWGDITGATSSSYTPVSADVGRQLRAVAFYDDSHRTKRIAMSAATDAVAAPPPAKPTVSVTLHEDIEDATIDESETPGFVFRADRVLSKALTVRIAVTYTGDYNPQNTTRSTVQIPKDYDAVLLELPVDDDMVDEVDGSLSVSIVVDVNDPYIRGIPATASVTIEDDDKPAVPLNLEVNGHVKDGTIRLRFVGSPGATSYEVLYTRLSCTQSGSCPPTAITQTERVTTMGVFRSLEGTAPRPAPLPTDTNQILVYQAQVRALGPVDPSEWSQPVGVYPTSAPLTHNDVAGHHVHSYQPDSRFHFVVCGVSDEGSQPLPTDVNAQTVERLAKAWEEVARWRLPNGENLPSIERLSNRECDHESPFEQDQFFYANNELTRKICRLMAWGCYTPLEGYSLSDPLPFGTVVVNDRARTTELNEGDCSRFESVVYHEFGHALGLAHNTLRLSALYDYARHIVDIWPQATTCKPTLIDGIAVKANYQSR